MKKMKIKLLIFVFLIIFSVSAYGDEEKINLESRFLNNISLYTSDESDVYSGEEQKYILHVKDDLGNNLNGSYKIELINNHLNQKINIIPRESFYFSKTAELIFLLSYIKAE